MMYNLVYAMKRFLLKNGFDICRVNHTSNSASIRSRYLCDGNIDTLLDIGANRGQFALQIRKIFGYKGRIVSFEPLSGPFEQLRSKAENDDKWTVVRCALGAKHGRTLINVSRNSCSSSLLEMYPRHMAAAPASQYLATEEIDMLTLDQACSRIKTGSRGIYMKIDAQGYEDRVLEGAQDVLGRTELIQTEMSITSLYKDGIGFLELRERLRESGFVAICLENGFADPRTHEVLQLEGYFVREKGNS